MTVSRLISTLYLFSSDTMKTKVIAAIIKKLPSLAGFLFRKYILKRPSKEVTIDSINNFVAAIENKVEADPWLEEQVKLRISLVFGKSPACIESGRCVNCGCDIPDKFYEPKGCDYGCYGDLPERSQKSSEK